VLIAGFRKRRIRVWFISLVFMILIIGLLGLIPGIERLSLDMTYQ
jgi:hypothetical protein